MAAGIGADAEMVYRLTLGFKQRWGMAAYYAESTRQWLTHDFPLFIAEFRDPGGQLRREQVSQVLAIRISWFGGLLKSMATAAALTRDDFHLVLFKTRRRFTYLRYMLGVSLQHPWPLPEVEILPATQCRCLPLDDARNSGRIYAEADGELLGTLPVSLCMTSETVNLLVPEP
jgi:diacylglycerol kinase family enzyme